MVRISDSHIHLYADEFNPDRNTIIRNAIDQGIHRFFIPNIDSTSFESMYRVCDDFPEYCFPMMGLHPCSVKENYREELTRAEKEFSKRKFYAVGEIGLDYYWDKTFIKEQHDALMTQCRWASEKNLPVVIHSRNATDLLIELFEENSHLNLKGIFHCFSGNTEQANRIISMGFYLGIGGVITFKNSGLEQIIKQTGVDHLVLETDGPYLAPVPYRGKRNEPAYLKLVLQKVAEAAELSEAEVAQATENNINTIFGSFK